MANVTIFAQYRDFIGNVKTVQIGEYSVEEGLEAFKNIRGQELLDDNPWGDETMVWGMQAYIQDNNTGIKLRTRRWDRAVDAYANIHPVEQIS